MCLYDPFLNAEQLLAIVYYLLIQDRYEEALGMFERIRLLPDKAIDATYPIALEIDNNTGIPKFRYEQGLHSIP